MRDDSHIADAAPLSTAQDAALYDAVADQWWSGETRWVRTLQNLVPPRLRYFDKRMGDWESKRVLDLGCAGGFMAEPLAKRGAIVHGVDPSAGAIAAARAHAEAEGLAIDYRTGYGEDLPFADDQFDAVVCVDVLEHVRDLDRVLSEVARVLKPGGWFFFDTINQNMLARFAVVTVGERVLGLLPRGAHDPALFIHAQDLAQRLEARRFKLERFRGIGPTGLTRRADFAFGLLPFTMIIYVGAGRLAAA